MYNTTSTYKAAVRATTRHDNLIGTIYFANGTTKSITTADIDEGSVSIVRECVEGNELMFGGSMLGELNIAIRTSEPRYAFYGAIISLTYQVETTAGWENIPLGLYCVSEADKLGVVVKLVAYDNMRLLDTPFGTNTLNGLPFNIIEEIARQCKIELAFDEDYILAWPNSSESIQIDKDSGCNTFRDALKIICQLLGCFATITRDGKLTLAQFQTEECATITKGDRYKLTVADYLCSYRALSITGIGGTYVATSESQTDTSGLTMYYEDAPAWDYGLAETLQLRTQTLFDYLETISYTPVTIEMPGDPSYDCGDRFVIKTDDIDVETIITKYEWKFRNKMSIYSEGPNPYLENTSSIHNKTTRQVSREADANKLTIYKMTNLEEVSIRSTETKTILEVDFSSSYETAVLFFANIKLQSLVDNVSKPIRILNSSGQVAEVLDANGQPLSFSQDFPGYVDVVVSYRLNDIEVPFYPKEHYSNGDHTLSLFYLISEISGKTRYNWKVILTVSGGSVYVDVNDAIGTLIGQGLGDGEVPWDGKIFVEENLEQPIININGSTINIINPTYGESVSATTQSPIGNVVSDSISKVINIRDSKLLVIPNVISANVGVGEVILKQTAPVNMNEYTKIDGSLSNIILKTDYTYTGEEVECDDGKMSQVYAPTTDKELVSEIEVKKIE